MGEIAFHPWPKIPHLFREIVISEKLDGTNAAITIDECDGFATQSRKRIIVPGDDNFAFAKWAYGNRQELTETLGPGTHFGEWWGSGIQRGYGFKRGERTFSLFNTVRWRDELLPVEGLSVVPQLYIGNAHWSAVDGALNDLRKWGSFAAQYDNPEGIVIFHSASNSMFKVTLDNDSVPKALVAAQPRLALAA